MMEKILSLDQLKLGQSATIKSLEIEGIKRRRLQDLGFIEGSAVQAVYTNPAGNPTAYLIRGTMLALRNEDAEQIKITLNQKIGG